LPGPGRGLSGLQGFVYGDLNLTRIEDDHRRPACVSGKFFLDSYQHHVASFR
jgi:hypothetical protein